MIVPRAGFSSAEKECKISNKENAEPESNVKLQKKSEQKKRKSESVFPYLFFAIPCLGHNNLHRVVLMDKKILALVEFFNRGHS